MRFNISARRPTPAFLAPFEARLSRIQDKAADAAVKAVQAELDALATRFKRHTFHLTQGMGVTFVSIQPELAVLPEFLHGESEERTGATWRYNRDVEPAAFTILFDAVERIMRITEILDNSFNRLVGDLTGATQSVAANVGDDRGMETNR